MSHWTTSGRSRLKARQKNTFAQRAQMRANVVVAGPQTPVIVASTNHPHHAIRSSITNQQRSTGSKRRLSYSNPIYRKGVRVQIPSPRTTTRQVLQAESSMHYPVQPQSVRRIRDPRAARYQSSRAAAMTTPYGYHASPSYPGGSRMPADVRAGPMFQHNPFADRSQSRLADRNEGMHHPATYDWQEASSSSVATFSPHPHTAHQQPLFRGRPQALATPRPPGIARFQKKSPFVDALYSEETFGWGGESQELAFEEASSFGMHRQSSYSGNAMDLARKANSGRPQEQPPPNLDFSSSHAMQHQARPETWDAIPPKPPMQNRQIPFANEITWLHSNIHQDNSVAEGIPDWENLGDGSAGISLFKRGTRRDISVPSNLHRDGSSQQFSESWREIPVSSTTDPPPDLFVFDQQQPQPKGQPISSPPMIHFFNNGAEVDLDGRPLSSPRPPAATRFTTAASDVGNDAADSSSHGLLSGHLPDEDLWNQAF